VKIKIKLLFCINSLSEKGGGAEKILSIILKYLVTKNFDISLITFDKKHSKFFYNFPLPIKVYRLGNFLFLKNKYLSNLNKIIIYIIYLLKIKPKISFGFMHSTYISLALAAIFSKTRIVACEHILPSHFVDKRIEFFIIKIALFFVDKISVVSNQVKNQFSNLFKKKIEVLDNIVDLSDYPKKNKHKKQKIILSVGRMAKQKNFTTLIEAFHLFYQKIKDWRLIIIGDGYEKKILSNKIKDLNLKKYAKLINFKKNLTPYYRKSSIYVCSSIYESFGLTVAEALVHKLPCVAFKKCTGVNKIIQNKKNGLLINGSVYNHTELSKRLHQLANNTKVLKKMQNFYDPNFLIKNTSNKT
jgi:glycosyltransferase involved in cell wall biosynthesis